jgi:PKD repeat protein
LYNKQKLKKVRQQFIFLKKNMISNDEKNVFLQDLEEEELAEEIKVKKKKPRVTTKKGMSGTSLFAAFSVFSIFIILLLIFLLSLADTENQIFITFGIEPSEIKTFLISLLNKSFFFLIIFLLLATSIGIFRGYSFSPKEKEKRRSSFLFGAVSGALIFVSLLSWGVAYAFINNFVVEVKAAENGITILERDSDEAIIAPVDLHFSAKVALESLTKQGKSFESIRWSKDGGKNFTNALKKSDTVIRFYTQGPQKVDLYVLLSDGTEEIFSIPFYIEKTSFEVPSKIYVQQSALFNAEKIIERGKNYEWDFDNDGIYEESSRNPSIKHTFKKAGKYTVNVKIESKMDTFDFFSRDVMVFAQAQDSLVADISTNTELLGEAPFSVEFDASKSFSEDGSIKSFTWLFGDEKKEESGKIVNYTFTKPGKHSVTLTVENRLGETASEKIEVEVLEGNSPPIAVISSVPKGEKQGELRGVIPFEVNFSGKKSTDPNEDIVEYKWILEDKKGETEEFSGSEIPYIFRQAGEFTMTLEVSDKEGQKNTEKYTVYVDYPSVSAVVKTNITSGAVPFIVKFNASESSCRKEDCVVNSFTWDFKDGSKKTTTGAIISHEFTKPGEYPVEVVAHTNIGEDAVAIAHINATESPFKACFTSSRSTGVAPATISFSPSSCSEGEISQYKWDFGDGFVSQSKAPSHTFKEPGEYTVILHIFDKNNRVSEATKTITVLSEYEE